MDDIKDFAKVFCKVWNTSMHNSFPYFLGILDYQDEDFMDFPPFRGITLPFLKERKVKRTLLERK